MTITTTSTTTNPGAQPSGISGSVLVDAAETLGPQLAEHTARHDDEGSFVSEGFELLRRSGYLASPVPAELGGGGATTAEVAFAQAELARHCGATALASTMHLHATLVLAWRWRQGLPGAEKPLRRIVEDGLVLASTGGGDFTRPVGDARRVDGGWEVSGRKTFVSGVPAAQIAVAWALSEEGDAIAFSAPLDHPSVHVVETWDAPGMRGTASHDVVFDGFFVPDEAVSGRRPVAAFAPVLAIVAAKALTVIAATYLGVAVGARDDVVARLRSSRRVDDPGLRRRIGLIDQHLLVARSTLESVLGRLGDDPEPTTATFSEALLTKRAVIENAKAVGDLAMDALGGRSYRRGDVVERAWRDLRAGPFHPLDHELTLRVAGDVALGLEPSLG
jgi:alkylation response protein AidB-like acyl-CoA dehydrogenase